MAIDLGKQVGPLPLGAWIVVVGAGLGIAYVSYRNSSGEPEEAVDTGGQEGVGDGSTGGWTPTQPPEQGMPQAPVIDNEGWAVRSINWLIAQGYPPASSDSAIRKYISGESERLSISEWALVTLALGKWGSPPQPLPPGEGNPPGPTLPPSGGGPVTGRPVPRPPGSTPPVKPKPLPPKPKPPTKPAFRYVTVTPWPTKHSTLGGIARTYKTSAQAIFNANRAGKRRADGKMGMISNMNKIYPGWRLLLP